ncbi:hypothetical protein B5F33_09105 [Collinsella sp. An2]|nr:hypothetical protein B5F33_09105 [Collinsella sp. An2]
MRACVCNISGLELLRSYGRLLPELLELPRTSKTTGLGIPPHAILEDELVRVGVKTRPYHLMVGSHADWRSRDDVVCHKQLTDLPRRSLIVVNRCILVTGPELLFCDLASSSALDELDLILIGYELCGTYVVDQSWDGLVNTGIAMTSVEKIARLADQLPHRRGIKRARGALSLIRNGSNSPMETILCMLLTLPRRLGGLDLGPVALNYQVQTSTGPRWIDAAFVAYNLGLEYKGKEAHSLERTSRDDRRQNKIAGTGMTILNVWYDDLVQEHLFQQLVDDIARATGRRIRVRSDAFATRQQLLRQKLLPAIERYGSFL